MSRLTVARIFIVIGTLLAVLSILAVWVSRQVLETDQWTQTSSQLLEQPAVRTALSNYLVDQLYDNVDVQGEIAQALPPRFAPLAGPASGGLRRAAEDVALRALENPDVQALWENANRQAHAKLVDLILHGGGEIVSTDQGVVSLDLKALLTDIAQRTGLGGKLVGKLPASAASIQIVRSDELHTVQKIAKALKPLTLVFVLLTLACYAVAVAVGRDHRRQMIRAAGLSFIFAGAATLVVRQLLGSAVVDKLASTASVEPAVEDVWHIATSMLVDVATATIAYGALAVAGAWLAGPTRLGTRVRTALAPYLLNARLTYGVVTGIVLLVLIWGPTEGTRRLLPVIALTILLYAGVEALRRVVRREVEADGAAPPDGGPPPAEERVLAQT